MRDFNIVFVVDHREGRNEVTASELVDGCDFLLNGHLGFVPSVRYFFSWHKTNKGIRSRIDHVISNDAWNLKLGKKCNTSIDHVISNDTI